jgi:myo-inositol-1(or 4)-monophosphatase
VNSPAAPSYDRHLAVARAAADAAGRILIAARREGNISVGKKGMFDFVTETDLAIHDSLSSHIAAAFPSHTIISEEGSSHDVPQEGECWLIDPIDGTSNFIHGHDHVAISIAYLRGGETMAGVVIAPFVSQTFWAIAGSGAYRDGVCLRMRAPASDADVLVGIGFPHDRSEVDNIVSRLPRLLSRYGDVRRLASPALDICWVADGRLGAFLDRIHPWDIAAAGLVAKEAGAAIARLARPGPAGKRSDGEDYLVAHPALASRMMVHLDLEAQP